MLLVRRNSDARADLRALLSPSSVKHIRLVGCTMTLHDWIILLQHAPQLERLDLLYCQMTILDVVAFLRLSKLRDLTINNMSMLETVSFLDMAIIANHFMLAKLNIVGCQLNAYSRSMLSGLSDQLILKHESLLQV